MSDDSRTKVAGFPAVAKSGEGQAADLGNCAGRLLARISLLPALLVTGWLLVGLPLLMAGRLIPALMLVLALPVMAVFGYAGWHALAGDSARRPAVGSAPWWSVIGVIVVALAFGVDQMIFHSQFIIVTRDPATYVQFGAWISKHGYLPIPQYNAAFGHDPNLSFNSAGFYQIGRTVVPQFMAGLPLVLAGAFWIGGISAAVTMAPILGACALLTFGGLVARLVGPRWAPLATLALALALPMQFTSRSTYSEPLAAILFLGGLCLVVDYLAADGHAARILAGLGSLALGLTFLVRLDGASDILPVIPYCGMLVAARRRHALLMIAGFAVGVAYGVMDGTVLSWPYLQGTMSSVAPLTKIAIAVLGLTIVAALVLRGRRAPKVPGWVTWAVAATPIVIMAGFAVRPYLQIVRAPEPASYQAHIAGYQRAEHLTIDPSRVYYESSLHWVFWYIGIPAVVLGTIGAALLVRSWVRGGLPAWTLPLMVFSWAIVATLYRPAIFPDQPWASRRLVPAVLPGFILLAVWAACRGTEWLRARGTGMAVRGVVVGCCAVALVLPATVTTFGLSLHTGGRGGVRLTADGLAQKTTFGGEIAAVQGMCGALPKNGSALFIDADGYLGATLAEVIRGMCGVPAAVALDPRPSQVRSIIRDIRRAGRVPVLLSGGRRALFGYGGVRTEIMALVTPVDGHTLAKPPMATTLFSMYVWMTVSPR